MIMFFCSHSELHFCVSSKENIAIRFFSINCVAIGRQINRGNLTAHTNAVLFYLDNAKFDLSHLLLLAGKIY